MSQPDLSLDNPPRGVITKKPKTNVYMVMLMISLVAMLLGCIFLYLELSKYSGASPA
ncbi:MAG: hypothetical protein AAF790_06585 [Planctomycetota bacterium]